MLSVWRFDEGSYSVVHECDLEGHSPRGIKAVDADELRAATCGRDGTLRTWCLRDRRETGKVRKWIFVTNVALNVDVAVAPHYT